MLELCFVKASLKSGSATNSILIRSITVPFDLFKFGNVTLKRLQFFVRLRDALHLVAKVIGRSIDLILEAIYI